MKENCDQINLKLQGPAFISFISYLFVSFPFPISWCLFRDYRPNLWGVIACCPGDQSCLTFLFSHHTLLGWQTFSVQYS